MKNWVTYACLLLSFSMQAQISINALVTDLSCHIADGLSDGQIELLVEGGKPPYAYSWSNGSVDQHLYGLEAGTYDVVVTDSNGDTAQNSFPVEQPQIISILASETDLLCNSLSGSPTGSVDVHVKGGTPGYTYNWTTQDGSGLDPTNEDQNFLSAGTYTLIVTDENGCSIEGNYTLAEPTAVECSLTSSIVGLGETNVLCNGGLGGIRVLSTGGTPPYIYSYDGGLTTFGGFTTTSGIWGGSIGTVFQIEAGSYTITTYDANGCESTCDITITEPEALNVLSSVENISCDGSSTGSITTFVTGGVEPYLYEWTTVDADGTNLDVSGTATIQTGLSLGTYTLILTDANGCQLINDYTIGEYTELEVEFRLTNKNWCTNNGLMTLDKGLPAGGAYAGVGVIGDTFDPAVAGVGTHTITYKYTDANGCTNFVSDQITVSESEDDVVTEVAVCQAELPLLINGQLIDGPGVFTSVLESQNGCSYKEVLILDVHAVTSDLITEVTVSVTDLPYSWNGQEIASAGTYVIELIDANGCHYEDQLILTVEGVSSSSDALQDATIIYPNPAQNVLYIQSDNKLQLQITNNTGQLITTQELKIGINKINTSDWNKGLYFLEFSDSINSWTGRVVISN